MFPKQSQQVLDHTQEQKALTHGLYIVATPIGNLADISFRAVDVLRNVDLILAEDTRKFGILAMHYGIQTKSFSYFDHNEKFRAKWALEKLLNGESIALVSDAGTPTISDPGFDLIQLCYTNSINIFSVPGASSAIAAVSISGLRTDDIRFRGFLPRKPGRLRKCLEEAANSNYTTIFFESPYRIVKSMEILNQIDSDCLVFIARELTKIYEEKVRGSASEVLQHFKDKNATIKGEFVMIIQGKNN